MGCRLLPSTFHEIPYLHRQRRPPRHLDSLPRGSVQYLRGQLLHDAAGSEELRHIAKRLQKARLIDHFNHKNAIFTMARRASGDCNFLDAKTRLCTVYDKRPETCRLHPQKKSPKPGYCAYGARRGS
jgi:Fe-S-cluster containining protein